ncbi:Hemolysin, chromosomal [Anatilimnocola aggregata]|uniref:Hemolysin, chromosomal n=1 Tax=Anatilimnocola aggregata TaxID=2528021 RepID=A0A517YDX2_9BACT|nr:autotransporter-associated beta strand repeat-containing protein [Anatilimnocola aggregata]QDU28454.1 Hemolysin, chromosomal [Anatilimnocola aggregata]
MGATLAFNVGGANEFTATDIQTLSNLGSGLGGFLGGSSIGFDASNAPSDLFTYSNAITDTNSLTNSIGVVGLGSGIVALTGANTYTGVTTARGGVLQFPTIGNLPGYNQSGRVTAAATGAIAVNVAGLGQWTELDISNLLAANNSGFAANSALGIDTAAGDFTYNSSIAGNLGITKLGPNRLTLAASNTYAGTTTIDQGTLTYGVNQALAGSLTFGLFSGRTNTGTLDLNNASASFGGAILVQTNNASANTISVGAGQSISTSGGLTIGISSSSVTATSLNVSGAGSFAIAGGNVNVGLAQAATNGANNNTGTLDLSGLTGALGFSANVTNFNLGFGSTNRGVITLTETSNSIIATTLNIGHSNGSNALGTSSITLGEGTNTIRADTINIGISKASGRLAFASPGVGTGTVTIRNKANSGPAAITVGSNNGTGTAGSLTGTLDLRGHDSSVVASSLVIALGSNSSNGSVTGIVEFDRGTFTASTVTIASKTTGTGIATGSLNISGGSFAINTGGTLTFASAVAVAGTAVGNISVEGGTLTSNINIVRAGGVGVNSAYLSVDGGTLNMAGGSVGTAAIPIAFEFSAGTLQSLSQLNGGETLTKSGSGEGVLAGSNTYTGATQVDGGKLVLDGTLTVSPINVSSNGTLAGSGTVQSLTFASGATFAPELNGAVPGSGPGFYDQVSVASAGLVDLTGVTLDLSGSTYAPVGADSFTILTAVGGISGEFAGLPDGSKLVVNNRPLTISYTANSVVLTFDANPVVNGTGVDDSFLVTQNGPNLEVSLNNVVVLSSPFVDINILTLNGLDGDDTLTIDMTNGNPIPTSGISFAGGVGGNDSMVVTGGSTTTVIHTFNNASDGRIVLAGPIAGTINYSGLEPVDQDISTEFAEFIFLGAAETITVTDETANDGQMRIDSDLFGELTDFNIPTSRLTIRTSTGAAGADTLTFDSVDAQFRASIEMFTDNNDVVNLNAPLTLGNTVAEGNVIVAAASLVNLNANINTDAGTATGGGDIQISAPVALGANVTLDTDRPTGTDGTISFGATANLGSNELTLNAGTANYTMATVISGTGSLRKLGGGRLTLTGASDYSGSTTIAAGIVAIQNATSLGSAAGGTIVMNSAALELRGNINVVGESLEITGDGDGALRNVNGNNTWGGNITVGYASTNTRITINSSTSLLITGNINVAGAAGNSLVFEGSGPAEVSGDISGTAGLIKSSTGTAALTLSGNNSYTGSTAISNGVIIAASNTALGAPSSGITVAAGSTLDVRADIGTEPITSLTGTGEGNIGALITSVGTGTVGGTVTFAGNADIGGDGTLNITGNIVATSGRTLNKIGVGTTNLDGNNNIVSGGTTVSAGRLNVNDTLISNVVVSGTGVLGGNGAITGNVSSTGTLSQVDPGNSPGTLTITGNYSANSTFEINDDYFTAGVGGDYDQIIVNGAANTINLAAATVTFVSAGGGTVPALPNLITLIQNDTLNPITPFANLAQGGTVTLGAGLNARQFIASYTGGDGNDLVLFNAAVPDVIYIDNNFSGGIGQTVNDADKGTTGNEIAIFGVNAFSTFASAQTVHPTFGGTFIVNEGTYSEAVVLVNAQTLEVTGIDLAQTVVIGSLAAASATQSIVLQGSSNLTVGNAANTSITAPISGTGSFTKQGGGTLTLNGAVANTFTGITTVTTGILTLGKSAGVNAVSGDIQVSGGTLQLAANNQISDTSAVSISTGTFNFHNGTARDETIASLTMTGGSLNTAAGGTRNDVTVTGATNVSAGNFTVNSGTVFSTNGLTLTGGTNIVGGNDTVRESQIVVGPGGLSMVGSLLTLYRGTLAGAFGAHLVLNGDFTASSSGSNQARIIDNGTAVFTALPQIDLGGGVRTITVNDGTPATELNIGVIIENGSLTKAGAGGLQVTSINTSTVTTTTVNAGLFQVATNTGTYGTDSLEVTGGTAQVTSGTLAVSSTATVTGGLLQVAGAAATLTTDALAIDGGTVQVTSGTATVSGAVTNAAGSGLLAIDNGAMTVGNGLDVDQLRVGLTTTSASVAATLTVNAGAVVAGSSGQDMFIGRRTTVVSAGGTTVPSTGVIDFSNASSVTLTASNLLLGTNILNTQGNSTGDNTRGTLLLSKAGTNSIAATTVVVGNSTASGHNNNTDFGSEAANGNRIVLGNAQNNLSTNTLTVGGLKSLGLVRFDASGGTLTLQGNSVATTTLLIGDNNASGTGVNSAALMDLSNGTFNGTLGNVTLGRHGGGGGGGSGVGTLTMDAGNVTASSLTLGNPSLAGTSTNPNNTAGTLNLNGGTFTVNGTIQNSNGAGSAAGTANVNLDGGTLQFITLTRANGPFNFNFSSGTIQNVVNQNLTISNVVINLLTSDPHTFEIDATRLGTVASTATITGAGSLEKDGDGTLQLNSSNTYSGTTNLNDGRLVLNSLVGEGAILNAAGTVTVQPGAELQLLTDETVSSFVGIDNPAKKVDGLLALGANRLTTTGDATIANVSASAGARIVAGGAIIDGDLDNNITGPNIFLQAATGIGSSGANGAIETAVSNIQLFNSTSGAISVLNSNMGALLTVSDLHLLGFGANNDGGSTTIVNSSPLTIASDSISLGDVVFTASDSAAVGDNLTVNSGVTVQSTGGSVTLNAGDDALLDGDVTAATQVTVNVDAGDGESNGVGEVAPGSGGTVTINGVITVNGGTGTTFLNGGDDYDTFDFDPQTTTSFSVNGNAPHGTADGDRLVITVPALTVQTVSDVGSGGFSFAPTANPALDPVTYVSIEEQDVTGGPLNLLIDLTPVYNGVNNQLTMQRVGADLVINRLGTGPVTGNFYTGTLATINSLEIRGGGQNDSVEVFDTGTGLPDFVGTVPGVTNNPNVVGTPEFLFTGGAGTDVLTFNLGLASTAQVYGIGSGSGTAANDGEISTTNPANTLITYFTSVSEVNRAGFNATAGGLQILGDLSGNTINTTDNGGGETRVQPTGYTPFDFSGDNFSSFEVYGLRGSDTLTLTSFGSGQTNNPTIVLDGSNPTGFGGPTDDGLADTLRVLSTSSNTGLVTLLGGLGSDQFFLAGPGLTVDDIAGPVVVDGEDNNLAGNNDQLFIDDSGDTTADPNVLIAAAGGMNADYAVTGINASGVTFRNIDSFDYTGTEQGDTIDGRFTPTNVPHDLNTVALRGFDGDDQFLLFTSNQWGGVTPVTELPFTRVASGVGTISLYGNDGEDIFGETPAPVIGNTGAMHVGLAVPATTRLIRPTTAATAGGSTIFIDGGDPVPALNQAGDTVGDVLNLDVTDVPKNTAMIVGAGSSGNVLSANTAPFSWVSIEDLNLVDNGKLTGVQIGDVFGRGTTGNDLMQISANATAALPHQVRVRIGGAIMNYNVPGKAVLYGGNGVDTMSQTTAKIPAVFYGEAGNDSLAGGSNNDWLVGGDGNDQITGGEGQNVIWGDNAPTNPGDPTPQDFQGANDGNDTISSGNGADVIYAGGGHDLVNSGGGNDYIHAGAGNDSVDAGAGDDRVYGYSGNDTLQGNSGNDLLSGGDGNDWLLGHSGNNVLIGGTGSDTLSGGDGNDLLITGGLGGAENSTWTSAPNTMTYAANTYSDPMDNDAALLALLTAWQLNSNAAAPPPEVLALLPILTDNSDDDSWGGNGSDLFHWDAADMADESLTAPGPNDFNNPATGPDVRLP